MKTALNRLLSYEQPQKYIVETENYSETFSTPVLTAGKSFILGYTNETTGVYNGKESPVIIFDDFTGDKKYVDFDFKVKSSAMKLLHKVNTSDNLKYLFYALQSIKYTPFSHKRIWISEYSNFLIEYRHPQEQNAIVLALDGINQAIYNKKQELFSLDELVKSRFIEMFGNPISEPKWIVKKWNDVLEIKNGKDYKKNLSDKGNGYPVYGSGGFMSIYADTYLCEGVITIIGRKGNINNPLLVEGKIWNVDTAFGIIVKTDILNPIFFHHCSKFYDYDKMNKATTIPSLTKSDLLNLEIILPPIELQNEFAKFVKLIDKSKFIVQQQIKDLQELLDSKMDEYFR